MFAFFQNHFKPKTQHEGEKVDYRTLNILTEYQVFNLEFCLQELYLSFEETALVLDLMW